MPLQAPADYLLKLPDPTERVKKNLEMVRGVMQARRQEQIAQLRIAEQQRNAQIAEQEARQALVEEENNRVMQEELATFAESPTHRGAVALMAKYPGLSTKFKPVLESLSDDERRGTVAALGEAYYSSMKGDIDVTLSGLENLMVAQKNSGQLSKAAGTQRLIEAVKRRPGEALLAIAGPLAAELGVDNFANQYAKLAQIPDDIRRAEARADKAVEDAGAAHGLNEALRQQRESGTQANQARTRWTDIKAGLEPRKFNAMIADLADRGDDRLKRQRIAQGGLEVKQEALGLKKDLQELERNKILKDIADKESLIQARIAENERAKVSAQIARDRLEWEKTKREREAAGMPDLSVNATKFINESNAAANRASLVAQRTLALSGSFGRMSGAGWTARLGEAVRGFRGKENEYDLIRKYYNKERMQGVVDLLPRGVASDRDVELAMMAFMEPTANPKMLARFLRGMAIISQSEADQSRFAADWTSYNGHTGPASRGFKSRGRIVFPGDTIDESLKMTPAESVSRANQIRAEILKKKGGK